MPASTRTQADIVTIPLVAATNTVTYNFEFTVPVPPITTGKSQAQILWVQISYASNAVVGTRVPVFSVRNPAGATVFSIASINTQPANTVGAHSMLQGAVIFPLSILGLMRTIPVNGLYGFDGYSMLFGDLAAVSAGDTISGFAQLRVS